MGTGAEALELSTTGGWSDLSDGWGGRWGRVGGWGDVRWVGWRKVRQTAACVRLPQAVPEVKRLSPFVRQMSNRSSRPIVHLIECSANLRFRWVHVHVTCAVFSE